MSPIAKIGCSRRAGSAAQLPPMASKPSAPAPLGQGFIGPKGPLAQMKFHGSPIIGDDAPSYPKASSQRLSSKRGAQRNSLTPLACGSLPSTPKTVKTRAPAAFTSDACRHAWDIAGVELASTGAALRGSRAIVEEARKEVALSSRHERSSSFTSSTTTLCVDAKLCLPGIPAIPKVLRKNRRPSSRSAVPLPSFFPVVTKAIDDERGTFKDGGVRSPLTELRDSSRLTSTPIEKSSALPPLIPQVIESSSVKVASGRPRLAFGVLKSRRQAMALDQACILLHACVL